MAWQLLAAAAMPAITGLISGALNKPKRSDYAPQTKYMEKYLSQLRGKQTDREVFHMAMQPALRTIGAQGRKTGREIGYMTERAGLAGSGIEAQARLSAGKQTQEAMAQATEKATAAQIGESRRLGEEAMRVTSGIEQEQERASRAYEGAKREHKAQMTSTLVQGIGAVAGAGLQASYAGVQEASQLALATEIMPGGEAAMAALPKDMTTSDKYKLAKYKSDYLAETGGTLEDIAEYNKAQEEIGVGATTETAPTTETGAGTSFFKKNILNDLSSAQPLQTTQPSIALDESITTGEPTKLSGTPYSNKLVEMVGKEGGIQLPPYPKEREEYSATTRPPPFVDESTMDIYDKIKTKTPELKVEPGTTSTRSDTITVDGEKIKIDQKGFQTAGFGKSKALVEMVMGLSDNNKIEYSKWLKLNPKATNDERIEYVNQLTGS